MNLKLLRQVRDVGVLGGLKSLYHSTRHTGRPSALVVTSGVITEIHGDTQFDINGRFTLGTGRRGASHPRLCHSKFSTTADSRIHHTGDELAIVGPGSVLHIEGEFSIGDSYVNSHARILCAEKIQIGDNVAIAWNVQLLDDDRHTLVVDGEESERCAPIHIKDNVWVGHDTTVHKGVTISEGSVVASNSVVTDDVPPNTLVAGSPAEVVRENVNWR